ncbi:MAG: carboxypeptidase-like regulatory domain-containing protein [Thermomonas sp.]
MNNKTLAFAIATAALSLSAVTQAQSSSGNIVGDAKTGETVFVTGVDTGFKRELKIEKDGKFQIRRVPTGEYQVVRVRPDGSIDPVQQLVVRPGGNARVMEIGKSEAKDVFSGS